jgi:hypothetical protein
LPQLNLVKVKLSGLKPNKLADGIQVKKKKTKKTNKRTNKRTNKQTNKQTENCPSDQNIYTLIIIRL